MNEIRSLIERSKKYNTSLCEVKESPSQAPILTSALAHTGPFATQTALYLPQESVRYTEGAGALRCAGATRASSRRAVRPLTPIACSESWTIRIRIYYCVSLWGSRNCVCWSSQVLYKKRINIQKSVSNTEYIILYKYPKYLFRENFGINDK
jgi:hypothetical protein